MTARGPRDKDDLPSRLGKLEFRIGEFKLEEELNELPWIPAEMESLIRSWDDAVDRFDEIRGLVSRGHITTPKLDALELHVDDLTRRSSHLLQKIYSEDIGAGD